MSTTSSSNLASVTQLEDSRNHGCIEESEAEQGTDHEGIRKWN